MVDDVPSIISTTKENPQKTGQLENSITRVRVTPILYK